MRSRLARLVSVLAVASLIPLTAAQNVGADTGGLLINFDDVTAPCVFADTVALREEYAAQGVHFLAPAPLDGGGRLDECGNFGVSGHSSPNFLAFNKDALYSDGGVPKSPQGVLFDSTYSRVQVKAGSVFPKKFYMRAFDAGGTLIGSAQITLTSAVQAVSISAAGIRSIRFHSGAGSWVVDDLRAG
jgi:hypothetical protein